MSIEKLQPETIPVLAELFCEMWPDLTISEEKVFCEKIYNSTIDECFLAKEGDAYVGFAYVRLRTDYVEGATETPTLYLEGIYVHSDFRKKGIASDLLQATIQWGRNQGCTELGSDTELTNLGSLQFHRKLGFAEANRVICFIRKI